MTTPKGFPGKAPSNPEERAAYIEALKQRYRRGGTLDLDFEPEDVPDELLDLLFPETQEADEDKQSRVTTTQLRLIRSEAPSEPGRR